MTDTDNTNPPVPEGSDTYDTWIATEKLVVDNRYERPLNAIKTRKLAREFDPDALGKVYVSERSDGVFAILDGQHRVAAVQSLWGGTAEVPCLVYTGLSLADEARLFVEFNQNRTKPQPIDLFRANIEAGDVAAKAINAIVEARGLQVKMSPGRYIGCVQSLQRVYAVSPEVLERTLDALIEAWGVDQTAVNGQLVEGLGVMLARYGHKVSAAKLSRTLLGTHPRQVLAKARMSKEFGTGMLRTHVAIVLIDLYNKGIRGEDKRLAWDQRAELHYWLSEEAHKEALANPSPEAKRIRNRRAASK